MHWRFAAAHPGLHRGVAALLPIRHHPDKPGHQAAAPTGGRPMSELETPRTRRAVLAAALGAGAATVASAVARPLPAAATNGGNVLLGNIPGAPLDGTGTNEASATTGIHTTTGSGFRAVTAAVSEYGIDGRSTAVTGLGAGVYGESAAPNGYGVLGYNFATTGSPVGVHGEATGPTGVGVVGKAIGGTGAIGVRAISQGIALKAESDGIAVDCLGAARFTRSGRASVAANAKYVDVTVPGGLTSKSIVHATIQTYRAGCAILAARPNWPTAGKARIYLTKVASTTSSTPVAWMVTEIV
jgi:hypothetical protein